MHAAEKTAVTLAAALLVVFMAATVYAVTALDIGLPTCITSVQPFSKGEVLDHGGGRYELHYLAHMWAFSPAEVELPQGAVADIYLTTKDVIHGFQILGTNVNLMAVPGTVNYARVRFDRPGEYRVLCHEFCGSGHQNMMALIRVRPSSP